ncbi:MAG: hypothetical protein WAK16_00520 [Candidatus Cybelea sp.]
MILVGLSLPARAGEETPAKTVDAFYGWYVAHHGRVEKIWKDIEKLFDSDLYGFVEETYYKDDYKSNDILVSTCRNWVPTCKDVSYDFFTNARSPATSYTIGATHIEGSQATVSVTLQLSNSDGGESHVSAILRNDGGRYVIYNLLFEERGYYYAGPIVDLRKFLGAYNC